jgi:hypothetical protein
MAGEQAPGAPRPTGGDVATIARQLPDADRATIDSVKDVQAGDGHSEALVDAIEMIGEEQAAGLPPPGDSAVSPGMRYLHCSRTIHQLVTDRNRAVGIYLAVASLLVTASSALMNAHPQADLIIPFPEIQRWCLPLTFATLTVLAVLMAFLLIRTRIGLIYEVAKMNALLGLPVGRVQRVNPLSVFFIMHAIVSLAGGTAAGLFAIFMIHLADPGATYSGWLALLTGAAVAVLLVGLYIATVLYTTSDHRLQSAGR